MDHDRSWAALARDVLGMLPALVGADAPRIAADIHRALAGSPRPGGAEELRRVLYADVRVRSWIQSRPGRDQERDTSPGSSGYQGLAGSGFAAAVPAPRYVCKNPGCTSSDAWTRGFMGEPVPRCSVCTRVLSRETP
ncbi:hypothetical protein ACGF5O_37520 [Streptomyces sp. NPDC048291]|uniref:hypothetical protein n=1 Tax=Streptomyces sp. NPDC048291 TaxID=3365530 RepID=UPI003716E70E